MRAGIFFFSFLFTILSSCAYRSLAHFLNVWIDAWVIHRRRKEGEKGGRRRILLALLCASLVLVPLGVTAFNLFRTFWSTSCIHWLKICLLNIYHAPGTLLDSVGELGSEQGMCSWNVDLSCVCAYVIQRDNTLVKEQTKESLFVIKMVKETEVLLQKRLRLMTLKHGLWKPGQACPTIPPAAPHQTMISGGP